MTTLADAFLDLETHPETLEAMWAEAADLRNRFIQHMENRKVNNSSGYFDNRNQSREVQEQIEAHSQPSTVNWIGKLQELCQKRAARPLEKHEVCFTTETLGRNPHVYQSVVKSELFANGPFHGERCSSKKAAEHSASAAAIEGEFPQFFGNAEGQPEQLGEKTSETVLNFWFDSFFLLQFLQLQEPCFFFLEEEKIIHFFWLSKKSGFKPPGMFRHDIHQLFSPETLGKDVLSEKNQI